MYVQCAVADIKFCSVAVSMIWTSMVVVFVLMRFSASCKCSFEILKAERADLSPAGSDIFSLKGYFEVY